MVKTINQKYRDQRRREKTCSYLKKIIFVLVLLVAAAYGLYYFLFLSSVFAVQEVAITGSDDRLKEAIMATVDSYLQKEKFLTARASNIVFVRPGDITSLLMNNFPELAEVKVTKNLLHRLIVDVKVREVAGVWCFMGGPDLPAADTATGHCFYFDQGGTAFEKTERPPEIPSSWLAVDDFSQPAVSSGSIVASLDRLDWLNQAKKKLSVQGIQVAKAIIPDEFFRIDLRTTEGWDIYFNTQDSFQKQLNALFALLAGPLSDTPHSRLHYVDLRIPDRIYYR